MARARANCKCAVCGKEFEITAYKRNSSEAASFVKWAEENITVCQECEKKQREADYAVENEKAVRAAAENGWPQLTGTEKQAAWAATIRDQAIAVMKEYYLDEDRLQRYPYGRYAFEALTAILLDQTKASFWIDNRARTIDIRSLTELAKRADSIRYAISEDTMRSIVDGRVTLEDAMRTLHPEEEKSAEQPEEKPVRPEAVPETRKHPGSVDIRFDGIRVNAVYEKDEDFRKIVKSMDFVWKDAWTCKPGEMNGTAEDIAAELGSRLLNNGFAVRFDSQAILDKAVAGDYIPMRHRWIKTSYEGFEIIWGRNDNLYHQAKSLPGAKYVSLTGSVTVPERSWAAIVDFAAMYGCGITAKAQEKLDRLSGSAQAVAPAAVRKPEYNETNVLESSREVLADLRDE